MRDAEINGLKKALHTSKEIKKLLLAEMEAKSKRQKSELEELKSTDWTRIAASHQD